MVLQGATCNAVVVFSVVSLPLFRLPMAILCRAENSEIFLLLFWDKLLFHKDILKLSDLQHPRGPFSTRIEIPPFRPHFRKLPKTVSYEVNLAAQSSHSEVLLLSPKGGIIIFVYKLPLGCYLSCCGGCLHGFLTFIQIAHDHAVV